MQGKLVNGSRGVVVRFADKPTRGGHRSPIVRFMGGREVEIGIETWTVKVCVRQQRAPEG